MVIKEKLGRLLDFKGESLAVDWLPLEWYEASKRILHKQTISGRDVVLKFLKEAPHLQQDDVLYKDEDCIIAVDTLPCDVIVIQPISMYGMALACYEIGNKHLPLYYERDALLIPYDAPLFRMLQGWDFELKVEQRKLHFPLKTSVVPHEHRGGESLFSKVLKLTTSPHDR